MPLIIWAHKILSSVFVKHIGALKSVGLALFLFHCINIFTFFEKGDIFKSLNFKSNLARDPKLNRQK